MRQTTSPPRSPIAITGRHGTWRRDPAGVSGVGSVAAGEAVTAGDIRCTGRRMPQLNGADGRSTIGGERTVPRP